MQVLRHEAEAAPGEDPELTAMTNPIRASTWEEVLWQECQPVVGTPSLSRLRSEMEQVGFPPIRITLDQDRETLDFDLHRSGEVNNLDKEQTLRRLITGFRAAGFGVGFTELCIVDVNSTSLTGTTLVGPLDEVCERGAPLVGP